MTGLIQPLPSGTGAFLLGALDASECRLGQPGLQAVVILGRPLAQLADQVLVQGRGEDVLQADMRPYLVQELTQLRTLLDTVDDEVGVLDALLIGLDPAVGVTDLARGVPRRMGLFRRGVNVNPPVVPLAQQRGNGVAERPLRRRVGGGNVLAQALLDLGFRLRGLFSLIQ